MPPHLDLLDFEVGDCGAQLGVPVDEALVLVDQPLIIERDEYLDDGAREAFIHGEALSRPVAGGAETFQLVEDDAARLGFPRPHALQELLASHGAAGRLLALQELAFDHHLGSDACVVGADLPQYVAAAHALEAAQHVLQRVVERVPDMERTGDVRRRDDDGVGLGVSPLRPPGAKRLGLLPRRPDAALDVARIVGFIDHFTASGTARQHRWSGSPARPVLSTPATPSRIGARRAADWASPHAAPAWATAAQAGAPARRLGHGRPHRRHYSRWSSCCRCSAGGSPEGSPPTG
jgi:hypothetical protein